MRLRLRTFQLVVGCALLLAVSQAGAAEGEPPVVARLFGEAIVASDLDPPPEDAATLDETGLRTARALRLKARVWFAVLDDYARGKSLEPTEAEVISHVENGRRLAALLSGENERRRAAVAVELTAPGLDAARRAPLEKELAALDVALAHDAARRTELEHPERRGARDRAERRVAREWVYKWKLDQALFRDFGGRIAFQQVGWEPVDAYRALFEKYETAGKLVLPDPVWRPAVFGYFDHDFVYLDEAHGRFYFEKPWWERTPEDLRAAGF